MARSSNQKLKILYLMRLLLEETDEDHTLTAPDMIARLAAQGIDCERKSLYDDLEALRRFGLDVEVRRGKTHNYYIGSRDFELPELKLLADAVASSRFLTHKKSEELIGKIEGLGSVYQARRLRRQVFVVGRVKSPNERIYYNVDTLHEAIGADRQISFLYFEYTVEKKKHYRRSGEPYVLSPLSLTWDDENYYLIGYYPKHNAILHFRVDKMEQIHLLEDSRLQPPRELGFDPALYTRKVFGMYGGEEEMVRIAMPNRLIGVALDRFGPDVFVRRLDGERFTVDAKVAVSPQFFAWVFGLGGDVQILAPDRVAKQMQRQLAGALERYL